MNFNKHFALEGKHALLGASSYHWVNYSEEKFDAYLGTYFNKQRGTELHDLACRCIKLGVKLPRSQQTLNLYVNDAIKYGMTPEVVLRYSDNVFGTADAIAFRSGLLRIHDLKTGTTKASMTQLDIYVALFCLEYQYEPDEIDIEERIYQNDDVRIREPDPNDILFIMDKIELFDRRIEEMRSEEII